LANSAFPITGPALMFSYLTVAVILMLNMLIAMMSYTFEKHYHATVVNARFTMAVLLVSWGDDSDGAPAPFNVLSLVPWLFSLIQSACRGRSTYHLIAFAAASRIQRMWKRASTRLSVPRSSVSHGNTVGKLQEAFYFTNISPSPRYTNLDDNREPCTDLSPETPLMVAQGPETDYMLWSEKFDIATLVTRIEEQIEKKEGEAEDIDRIKKTLDEIRAHQADQPKMAEAQSKAMQDLKTDLKGDLKNLMFSRGRSMSRASPSIAPPA